MFGVVSVNHREVARVPIHVRQMLPGEAPLLAPPTLVETSESNCVGFTMQTARKLLQTSIFPRRGR